MPYLSENDVDLIADLLSDPCDHDSIAGMFNHAVLLDRGVTYSIRVNDATYCFYKDGDTPRILDRMGLEVDIEALMKQELPENSYIYSCIQKTPRYLWFIIEYCMGREHYVLEPQENVPHIPNAPAWHRQ